MISERSLSHLAAADDVSMQALLASCQAMLNRIKQAADKS